MSRLVLSLKGEYFDLIASGMKPFEYRLQTEYWRKRLVGRTYTEVEFTRGYPKRGDSSRRIVKPWHGYEEQVIQNPFFGPEPVDVFAIRVASEESMAQLMTAEESWLELSKPSGTIWISAIDSASDLFNIPML